ncbi:MAG: phosphocholine cytidylyltransferase family protein [Candidatus Thiodiazotropha sp. (ex Troendleina suluensis)]|nr:phosphocholine cytidylyltransferase family protein [Candidatus Thiodiazotropha sp. (ex Troendleina suluensis)]
MGTRLGGLAEEMPKGFLRLGQLPIIEESIARLKRAGIRRIVIVTGYQQQYYKQLVDSYAGLLQLVHNPRYAESGSMYSLYLARKLVQEDFLLLESDLIYQQSALDAVLTSNHENTLLLSGHTGSGDEVYVECRGALLCNMSKDRGMLGERIAGELVGITRISKALYDSMCQFSEIRFAESLHLDYETDCLVGVAQSNPIHGMVVEDLLWSEIDDKEHLSRALTKVYPKICEVDAD